MGEIQKELEDLQERLIWVKSQWTDVIAEACSSIAAAPKLQDQLEAKFGTQANVIYRCLQQIGARPSRALQSPDINAELPQKIQHWNSEISMFTNELWDWKIFRLWRRRVRDSGNMDQEGRKLLSQGDTCSELFEDLVKYKQQMLDRAISWVNCWRHRARQYMEARKRRLRYNRLRWPAREKNDYDDDFMMRRRSREPKKQDFMHRTRKRRFPLLRGCSRNPNKNFEMFLQSLAPAPQQNIRQFYTTKITISQEPSGKSKTIESEATRRKWPSTNGKHQYRTARSSTVCFAF